MKYKNIFIFFSCDSMTASVISVPRRATLYDLVQHVVCVDALQADMPGRRASLDAAAARIPSDQQFWRALRLAVKQHPEATQNQKKRMLRLHDSTTNETIIISQDFLKEFVALYEADATYTVTVSPAQQISSPVRSSAVGARTFSCNQEFWDHVLLAYASTVSGGGGRGDATDAAEALRGGPHSTLVLSVSISKTEHRTVDGSVLQTTAGVFSRKVPTWLQNLATLQLTVSEWNEIVAQWNRLHVSEGNVETQAAAACALVVGGEGAATTRGPSEDDTEEGQRRRSLAVFAAESSYDFVAEARRRLEEVSAGGGKKADSACWTHFMSHWALLEAQYRNYL
jgi:hypothetical protein